MKTQTTKEYKEIDRKNFIKLNELQLEFVEEIVKIPAIIEALKEKADNLTGRYQYFQVFYNTRAEKNKAKNDRSAQALALNILKNGSSYSVREALIDNKLRLEVQKELKPVLVEAKKSEDPEIAAIAKNAVAISRKLDRQRNLIIMSKHKFVIGLSKKDFFNIEPEEVEQIAMLELTDIVERYNLDEKLSIFSSIKKRISHVLRRTYFDESSDALNKNVTSLNQPVGSQSSSGSAAKDGDENSMTLAEQITNGEDTAGTDHEFCEGLSRFLQLVESFPKQKRYIAKKYFLERETANVNKIADEIGHKSQYVYKVVRSIEKEFRASLAS